MYRQAQRVASGFFWLGGGGITADSVQLSEVPLFLKFVGSGQVAQLVEQRTENPCVGSSILPLAI
jgi:hypothetical protein